MEGGAVERPSAVLIRHEGLNPTRCQLRHNRKIAIGGGEVERLAASELRSANAQAELLLREALTRRGVKLDPPKGRAGALRKEPESGA